MHPSERAVVITGGTGALGVAVARRFLEAGLRVHVTAPASGAGPNFELTEHPGLVVHAGVELADETAVEALYDAVPGLTASVHVAGGFAMRPLLETQASDLEAMLSTNLRTAFLCTRAAARRLGEGGAIVNVAARAALEPAAGAGMVAYATSKAAVAAMTVAAAKELAPRGVRVNAIAPSIIDTPANRAAMPAADHASWPTTAQLAEVIFWLSSPASGVVSGTVVPVYGRAWPG